MEQQPSGDALRVLWAVRERAMDGYSVLKLTSLKPNQLTAALQELLDRRLVSVKGQLNPEYVGEAYLSVPPDALGYADLLLGRTRAR